MTRTVRIEKRQRGFFGQIFKWLFIIFNALMLIWLVAYWAELGEMSSSIQSDAESAGLAIGGTIGSGMLLTFWVLGDIILGLFVLFTRGKKVITEEVVQ